MGLKLVNCEKKYWDFVMELRNNLREGFVCQEIITKENHYTYMEKNYEHYYICLEDNTPVGWAGSIDKDIRVATHPDHQKKGVGKFLINQIMDIYPDAFESCGFKRKFYILEKEDA